LDAVGADLYIFSIFRDSLLYSFTSEFCKVVWWSDFLAADPEVAVSIPGAARFSEYQWVWNGAHSVLVRINEELLKSSGSGLEN
jgi:hypothetical protein